MIKIRVLGSAQVAAGEGNSPVAGGQQARRLALLGYLACARPRGSQRRDVLLGLLWPELDEAHARSALRQALHGIRRSFGGDAVLSHGTELIELNQAVVSCDLWEMQDAMRACEFQRVIDLYQGELLAGLYVSGAAPFENWLDAERTYVRSNVRDCAWRAADAAVRDSSPEMVVRAVCAAVDVTGYDEASLRRGMRMLATTGARAEALSIFERFRVTVVRELETEPDEETSALARELRCAESRSFAPVDKVVRVVGQVVNDELSSGSTDSRALRNDVELEGLSEAPVSTQASASAPAPAPKRPVRRGRRAVVAVTVAMMATLAMSPMAMSGKANADPRLLSIEVDANEALQHQLANRVAGAARADLAAIEGIAVLDEEQSSASPTAGTHVRLRISSADSGVAVRADVIDARTGTIIGTARAIIGNAQREDSALAAFKESLRVAVATALYPGWGKILSHPASYQGYQLLLEGLRRIKSEDHAGAIGAFQRAFAADSAFSTAGVLAGMELYQVGRFPAADSLATLLRTRRAQLAPVDERLVEWLTQSLRGDRIAARAAMQTVVVLAPSAELAWLQLAIDNVETARPTEAIEALDHIAPARERADGWPAYWATRAEAYHLMEEHRRELETVREGMTRNPEIGVLASYELRALAALGRISELRRLLDGNAARTSDAASTLRQVAMELRAHGHPAAANEILDLVATRYRARVRAESVTVSIESGLARTFYLQNDVAQSGAIYRSLLLGHPQCLQCAGSLGVLAARSGNRLEALHYDSLLAGAGRPFDFGLPLLFRARIAATLGDRAGAASLLNRAFAAGYEYDVLTHADADLAEIKPDSIYRAFARVR